MFKCSQVAGSDPQEPAPPLSFILETSRLAVEKQLGADLNSWGSVCQKANLQRSLHAESDMRHDN